MIHFPEIVADESVDARIITALRQRDYNVYAIAEVNSGIIDFAVIQIALEKNAFIITEDKDFGDEIVFKKTISCGTLLLRLHGLDCIAKISLVLNTLVRHDKELLYSFSVLTAKKLRIRKI